MTTSPLQFSTSKLPRTRHERQCERVIRRDDPLLHGQFEHLYPFDDLHGRPKFHELRVHSRSGYRERLHLQLHRILAGHTQRRHACHTHVLAGFPLHWRGHKCGRQRACRFNGLVLYRHFKQLQSSDDVYDCNRRELD